MIAPKIAVAALNPHGGEGGLLGREEIEEIGPAIMESRDEGYRCDWSDTLRFRLLQKH